MNTSTLQERCPCCGDGANGPCCWCAPLEPFALPTRADDYAAMEAYIGILPAASCTEILRNTRWCGLTWMDHLGRRDLVGAAEGYHLDECGIPRPAAWFPRHALPGYWPLVGEVWEAFDRRLQLDGERATVHFVKMTAARRLERLVRRAQALLAVGRRAA